MFVVVEFEEGGKKIEIKRDMMSQTRFSVSQMKDPFNTPKKHASADPGSSFVVPGGCFFGSVTQGGIVPKR